MRKLAVLAAILALGAAMAALLLREQAEPVTLSGAWAVAVPGQPGTVEVYVTLQNGAVPNRLTAVASAQASAAELVRVKGAQDLALPAGSAPSFSSDGVALRLSGLDGDLAEGRLIPIALTFDPSGTATTRAKITLPDDPHALMGHAMDKGPQHAEGSPPPKVEMAVTQVSGGYRIDVHTEHFTFAPDAPEPVHVPGEGHGHLYLDGLKLQRVYGGPVDIGALPPGRYVLDLALNTNTHVPYTDAQGPVAARAEIIVD